MEDPHHQLTKFVLVDEADKSIKQELPGLRKPPKGRRDSGVGTILSAQELSHFRTENNDYSSYIFGWIIQRVASIKSQNVKTSINTAGKDTVDSLKNSIRELEKHQSFYVDGEEQVLKMRDLAIWQLIK